MRLFKLVGVFKSLDDKKRRTQNHRQDNEDYLVASAARLREIDSQRHRQAAADERGRVDCAQRDIQTITSDSKSGWIHVAIQEIGQEEAAEEHYLLYKEEPHPDGAGIALLLHVVEMVL
jgi:hypothetical protein